MNKKLAAVGFSLIVLALGVGSGAFASGDEVTGSNTNESVFFAPTDTPEGNTYAEFDDGKIRLTVNRINPSAETMIDDVFKVGYGGREKAEVWVEHDSEEVTFYDETGTPVENQNSNERIVLEKGENASFGMGIVSGSETEILSQVTLVAILPTEEEDIVVSPPGGTGSTKPLAQPEPDASSGTDTGVTGRSRLTIDLGEINVRFRQPQFTFTTDVSDTEISVGAPGISGDIATVIDPEQPVTEETVVVSSKVENTGNSFGTTVAELRVNGRILDTREVEIEAGEFTTVDFAVTFDEPGRYEVAVSDSEPVTVFVTEEHTDLLIPVLLASILSLLALLMIYRRRKQEENSETSLHETPRK